MKVKGTANKGGDTAFDDILNDVTNYLITHHY